VVAGSVARADAEGFESGYGLVWGSVTQSLYGDADWYVSGEATENGEPDPSSSSVNYFSLLNFSVDACDSDKIPGQQGNSYDAVAWISADVSSTVMLEMSEGYSGHAQAEAYADFGGEVIVDVTIP
jgi:hypothetical protein